MLDRLGIQSYTFRTFDTIEKLADALQAAGISRLEAWPGHICHDHPAAETAQKVGYLAKRGISLSGYGGVALYNNEEEMREMFAFARDYGIGAMTLVDMKDDCLELIERLAEDYDVSLAAHNHGKNHWIGTRERLDAFFSKTSSRFGVCLDTAWAIHAGEDPIEMALYYKDRLLGVHLKDFVYDEASAKHKDVIIGSGGLDLPRFMQTLKDIGFKGYISLEYEGNADNPLPETQRCIDALKAALV